MEGEEEILYVKEIRTIIDKITYTRYVCPYCEGTLLISDNTAPVDLSEYCGHCGEKVHVKGETTTKWSLMR